MYNQHPVKNDPPKWVVIPLTIADTFYVTDKRSRTRCSFICHDDFEYCQQKATHLSKWGPRCDRHRGKRWAASFERSEQKVIHHYQAWLAKQEELVQV